MKKQLKIGIIIAVCIFIIVIAIAAVQNSQNSSNHTGGVADYTTTTTTTKRNYTTTTAKKISESKAISIAQSSTAVANKIANQFGLLRYYSPRWGECYGRSFDDYWYVYLKGTISGYRGEYGDDYEYDLHFKVTVRVSHEGKIESITMTYWDK